MQKSDKKSLNLTFLGSTYCYKTYSKVLLWASPSVTDTSWD